jgi:predicted hydrocarbon binding protein
LILCAFERGLIEGFWHHHGSTTLNVGGATGAKGD